MQNIGAYINLDMPMKWEISCGGSRDN